MRRWVLALTVTAAVVAAAASTAPSAREAVLEPVTISGLQPIRFPSRAAADWCGAGQPAAVDRQPDADLSSAHQVHVTYAVPADAPDQLASRAGPIVTDIAAIDAWWRGQDATRTLRFDRFAFPGCASKPGMLDIGFVRLPRPGSLYVGDAGTDRLFADLGQLAALSADKHLVYYDGPNVFDEFVCGTSFVDRNAPVQGGLSGIAFVWLRSLCAFDLGTTGIAATVAVHEVIHGLGSLIQGGPNECDPPNDGHVCDSPADILYPQVTSQTKLATEMLDVNRDDYYGHSRASFDTQDSGWLSHLPQFPLTVTATGGEGTVQMTSPATLDCGRGCTPELDVGTAVTLVAVPATGTPFLGWRGACTGTGICSIAMDAGKNVAALFGAASHRLSVRVTGKGVVVSTPGGLVCPTRCSVSFSAGVTVRLRATPAKGFRFAGWKGACSGSGPCLVPVDRDRTTRAVFREK